MVQCLLYTKCEGECQSKCISQKYKRKNETNWETRSGAAELDISHFIFKIERKIDIISER